MVVRESTLEVWDVQTGERRAAYPLERGFGPVPVVEDHYPSFFDVGGGS